MTRFQSPPVAKEYATFQSDGILDTNVDLTGKFVISGNDVEEFYEKLSDLCNQYRI